MASKYSKNKTEEKASIHDIAKRCAWARDKYPAVYHADKKRFLEKYEKRYGKVYGQQVSEEVDNDDPLMPI
jgi:hypothetical protein